MNEDDWQWMKMTVNKWRRLLTKEDNWQLKDVDNTENYCRNNQNDLENTEKYWEKWKTLKMLKIAGKTLKITGETLKITRNTEKY